MRPYSIFLITLFSLPALADDYRLDDLFSMSLEQLMQVPVSGATLTNESQHNVPAAVSVFTRAQIKRMGLDNLTELLTLVPGYQTVRGPDFTGSIFSSRGRRLANSSREVLILIDGRTYFDPRTGAAAGALPEIPLEQIERVEIIRGPGSALYGSSAFTGVINIISRKNANQITLGAGENSHRRGSALVSQQADNWQLDLFAKYAEDDGQTYTVTDNFSPTTNITTSDPERYGYLDLTLSHDNTQLRFTRNHVERQDFYSVETLSNDFNRNSTYTTQISLQHTINWQDSLHSQILINYLQIKPRFNTQITAADLFDGSPFASQPLSTDPLLAHARLDGNMLQFKWDNNWTRDEKSSLQFGVELRRDTEVDTRTYTNYDLAAFAAGNFPIDYYGNDFTHSTPIGTEESRDILGVYGQYQQELNTETDLTLGLRFDNYENIGTAFSPRLAVVHKLNPHHRLKLLYGKAFRAPSLAETGLINNPVSLGNPDLQHETVSTWNAIWLADWQNSSFSLGWFHNTFKHAISQQLVNGTRIFENGENEESQGLELEASQQINQHWLFRQALSHFTDLPTSAFREADTLASLLLNYNNNSWNANLIAVYNDKRDTLTPGNMVLTLDGYWLLHSKLCYQHTRHWQSFLQIKNMLDEAYQTPAQGSGLTQGIPNRGREWLLGIEYGF